MVGLAYQFTQNFAGPLGALCEFPLGLGLGSCNDGNQGRKGDHDREVSRQRERHRLRLQTGVGLHDPATLNDANEHHHYRQHQQNVNESAHGVRRNQTKDPEDNQDERNGPEHCCCLSRRNGAAI
jgi:hypothetical protein